jgi:hypothetical protein
MIGIAHESVDIVGVAFDILSLEALFLVPRIFSILSLNSYYGTLVRTIQSFGFINLDSDSLS